MCWHSNAFPIWSASSGSYARHVPPRPWIIPTSLTKIVNEDPRPSGELAGIPEDLEKVILRCLRKDPARRYQTMSDLKEALEDIEAETSGIVKNRREAPVSATG